MRFVILVAAVLSVSSHAARVADPPAPDRRLTPGAVLTTDLSIICQPRYTKTVRHTSGKLKTQIYRKYGIDK